MNLIASSPSAWLILPTYNEAENLDPFVRAALPQLMSATANGHVLILDDNSPDGTGEIANRLAQEHDCVEVVHRSMKEGLGPAYVAGFTEALTRGADLVLQMDSDFSHDPHDIPRLIAAARDADVVLGSRYVDGGAVTDWPLLRRLLSRGGCLYARAVLNVPIRDLTTGFKCFRSAVLARLPLREIETAGYGFQIEVTYRALDAGFAVEEVPIRFRDRRAGVSKMGLAIALEAVWQIPALRARRARGRLYEAQTR